MKLTQALTLVPERKREEKEDRVTVEHLREFLSSPQRDIQVIEFALPKLLDYYSNKRKDDSHAFRTIRGVLTTLKESAEAEEDSLIERLFETVVEKGVLRLGKLLVTVIWDALWDLASWFVRRVVVGAVTNILRWVVFPTMELLAEFMLTPAGLALALTGGALLGAYIAYKAFFSDEPIKIDDKSVKDSKENGQAASIDLPFGSTQVAGIPISVPPGTTTPANDLASLLQKGESNVANPYGVVNIPKGRGRAAMQPLEQMTVSQVMAAQAAGQFNAAGRYQIIDTTLIGAVKALHLTGNELFDRNLQDRIFNEYLTGPKKRPRLYAYLSGASNDVYAAAYDASQEWASVATPAGYRTRSGRISDGTLAYYDNSRNNPSRAHITAAQMIATLQLERQKRSGKDGVSTVVEAKNLKVAPEVMVPATTQGKIKAAEERKNGFTFLPPDQDKTIIKTPSGKLMAANM